MRETVSEKLLIIEMILYFSTPHSKYILIQGSKVQQYSEVLCFKNIVHIFQRVVVESLEIFMLTSRNLDNGVFMF